MLKYRILIFAAVLSLIALNVSAQFTLPFGDISIEELSNKPYKPDPGADAIILSDIGVAVLNYSDGFYIEFERDVRIRIVNSNGFDYANIEIPYSSDDDLLRYRASTFNIGNNGKIETKIPKKNFIIEKTSEFDKTLKFNFPDVHEGSVVEYSYVINYKGSAISSLVPWMFQSDIPVINSLLRVSYPEYFKYKTTLSGSAKDVRMNVTTKKAFYFGKYVDIYSIICSSSDMPAFKPEPYIMSEKEHLTKIAFELASVEFPNTSYQELSPTYSTLTTKLLERKDFGIPLKTNLKSLAEQVTVNQKDYLSKLKEIHKYVSNNILWNGVMDFTSYSSLKSVIRKEKGNSAEINMILIDMLRSVGIKADPLILSTRSNGSLNQYSAMLQQFNYLVAYVTIEGESYIVDATDPLRPFNILPFDCLNGTGRLINEYESKFIDLKNNEKQYSSRNLDVALDTSGNISGNADNIYSDYSAYNIRKLVRMKSEEGYLDIVKSFSPNTVISDYKINNLEDLYADVSETFSLSISDVAQVAGNEIIFNPFLASAGLKNSFSPAERKFPVDFGCPQSENYTLNLKIPDGYSLVEKPENITINIGKDDGKYEFSCVQTGDIIEVKSRLDVNRTLYQPDEYSSIRNFYSKILKKQSELIVLKKNS
ncbi:MAG TPA: DUF3857 domain-containing protein [Bacteroidales bacterium]|nr:DUF3857 domain-containing protein [Bacteroidales bacterium]HPT21042.1 DUF3857 domain-containing protein [Bacteroidales bacterium]